MIKLNRNIYKFNNKNIDSNYNNFNNNYHRT